MSWTLIALIAGLFLGAGILNFLVRLLEEKNRTRRPIEVVYKADEDEQPDMAPLVRREWLLSGAELEFFQALQGVLKHPTEPGGLAQALVMCCVRLGDLVFVEKGTDRSLATSTRNRINQKHVDFVLVEPESLRVMLAIELDDATHRRRDRAARDELVDRALESAGVPLLRWPARAVGQGYPREELAAGIKGALRGG